MVTSVSTDTLGGIFHCSERAERTSVRSADHLGSSGQTSRSFSGERRQGFARHERPRIGHRDAGVPAVAFEHDVAREHERSGGVKLKRLVCKRRITCTEDLERGSVDAELGLEGRGDVDLGQYAEALPAKASRTTLSARSIGRLSEVSMQSMFVPFS